MIDAHFEWFVLLAVTGVLAGCGGAEHGSAVPQLGAASHDETITHEACSGAHAEALDTNGDGKPDIEKQLDGSGHELCRIVDLNHDGKPDLYEYFDTSGLIRRREFCYDDTGTVNAIETYQGGRLAEREYDVAGQHRIDTWDWFDPLSPVDPKTGRPPHPLKRERDTNGDGQVNQWWTWNGDKVTIAADRTGSGQPDPGGAIVLSGPAGAAADSPSANAPPPAPDAGAPSANPAAVDGGQP